MTSPEEWLLHPDYPPCLWAEVYYRTGRVIFTNLNGQLTPELVAQLEQQLLALRNELMGRLTLFHYAAASGPPHQCVDEVYLQAVSRLKFLALTLQGQTSVSPFERRPPLTHEEVLDILEQLLPPDMPFGEERDETNTG
jgi:hypothetical protein